ncbi:MAG: type II toxin-antitoxin system PemK/MazF family toxin [bacterium]|nr:type II toxin-antitoxin system PemK/MazF family toxin [bacterium]
MFVLRLPKGISHEQQGKRYGVVVNADPFLPRSVVLIAPTSTSARPASYRPEIEVDETPTQVLAEHVGAVDVTRIGNLAGHLTSEEQWGVDTAQQTMLGLR